MMSGYRERRQLHLHKALGAAFDRQHTTSGIENIDGTFSFCNNLTHFDWKCVGNKEVLVPFNRSTAYCDPLRLKELPVFPILRDIQWERHRVWMVEGILHRGESDILPRRIFYMDEASWLILWGEGYDLSGVMVKWYLLDTNANSPPVKRGRWYRLEASAR